nr:dockerin type I repeat-containing protein [uncultured Ruminococcus sp.]
MMKKTLSVILLLALMIGVVSAVPMNVSAENVDVAETSATALFKGGDTDMDGTVNITDVTTLQMSMLNMRTPIDASLIANVGDVDQSNSLDITDATFIQRKLTGIETPDYVKVNEYTHEVTLPENNTLSQPKLKATTGASDITLSWNKISGADCYRVFTKKYGKWRHLADVCCMNDSKSEYVSEVAETSVESGYPYPAPIIQTARQDNNTYFSPVEGTKTLGKRVSETRIFIDCSYNKNARWYVYEITNDKNDEVKTYYSPQSYNTFSAEYDYNFIDGVTYTFRVWCLDTQQNQVGSRFCNVSRK